MLDDKSSQTQWGRYMTTSNPFVHPLFGLWWSFVQKKVDQPITVLEPFVGEGHLPYHLSVLGHDPQWVFNDIRHVKLNEKLTEHWGKRNVSSPPISHLDVLEREGKMFPKNYPVIITNPPFLAKNSASRKGLPFQGDSGDADVYQSALRLCLKNAQYVAILIPESFLTQGVFFQECWAAIQMPREFFSKTKHPVLLALFGPQSLKTQFLEEYETQKEAIAKQALGVFGSPVRQGRGSPGRAHRNENHKNARPEVQKVHVSKKVFDVLQLFLNRWGALHAKQLAIKSSATADADFVLFRQDRALGRYGQLLQWKRSFDLMLEENPRLRKEAKVICNDSQGVMGLFATDSTRTASIRFVKAQQIAKHVSIAQSARSISKLSVTDAYIKDEKSLEELIALSNAILEYYRYRTQDAFLTGFQEVRLDGAVRKRLDFVTAKKIVLLALMFLNAKCNMPDRADIGS